MARSALSLTKHKWTKCSKPKIQVIFYIQLNGLNYKINKKTYLYLPAKDSPWILRYTKSESEMVEKDSPCKWEAKKKKSGVEILIKDKISFKTKTIIKDKRIIYNDKEVNLTRRYMFTLIPSTWENLNI